MGDKFVNMALNKDVKGLLIVACATAFVQLTSAAIVFISATTVDAMTTLVKQANAGADKKHYPKN